MPLRIIELPNTPSLNSGDFFPVSQFNGAKRNTFRITASQIKTFVTAELSQKVDDGLNKINSYGSSKVSVSGDTMTGYLTLVDNPLNLKHASTKGYVDSRFNSLTSNVANSIINRCVQLTGSTMTGFLTLNNNPFNPMHAATKGYTDTSVIAASSRLTETAANTYVKLAGDTLAGYLSLHANPTNNMHAVTKGYTDVQISNLTTTAATTYVKLAGDAMTGFLTLNANPINGMHAATRSYVDSAVAGSTTTAATTYVKLAGDTMTGFLNLNNNPINAMHAATKSYVDSAVVGSTTTAATTYVKLAGDAMTGFLTLNANPINALHATTKSYVDSAVAGSTTTAATTYVKLAGDTMTGFLNLNANPTNTMHAATKSYVDTAVAGAAAGAGSSAASTYVKLAGDTMTGNLILNGNPSTNLQATPKQYVDTEINKSALSTKNYVDSAIASNISTTINVNEDQSKAVNEVGFIKKLAKMRPSSNNCAAITTTNRVIVWGYANGGETSTGGKLALNFGTGNRTPPSHYIRVPFQSDWNIDSGASGVDYLDENPTISIEDLYWNSFGAIALLSNGTCWVAGLNQGDLGVGRAPTTGNDFRPTCGFVQVDFGGNSIKQIQAASDNNSSNWIFTALDTNDSLWVWGNTSDGSFGTADALYTENISVPRKLGVMNLASWTTQIAKTTTNTVDFNNNILSWAINASEAAGTAISIVTKTNRLYISGENGYGQRGTGFITSSDARSKSGLFNQARKNASAFVEDAVSPEIAMYSGRQFHLYINTSGVVFGAGDNRNSYIGNNSTTDSSYFVSSNWPAGIIAEKIITHSYHYPTVFALCKNANTGVKTVYSWGYNGARFGYCGVNSNLDTIAVPTQVLYRGTGRVATPLNNVSDVFVSDQTGVNDGSKYSGAYNGGCVAIVDNNGYVYFAGYKTFNDPPQYSSANAQIFIRLPIKNVKDVILGGNVEAHQWTIILLKNGTVWGIGDPAQYLFGVTVDTLKHPTRLL